MTENELADRHDGVELNRTQLQATADYEIHISEDELNQLPEDVDVEEFAENLAASRAKKEFGLSFTLRQDNALAQETTEWTDDGRKFTVFVRFQE